jgi:hypothetical protein
MKEVILQIWEESFSDGDILPEGASIHLTKSDRDKYVSMIYSMRCEPVPKSYIRVCGEESGVKVSDTLYEKLSLSKTIKLEEYEFNNLIKFKEII